MPRLFVILSLALAGLMLLQVLLLKYAWDLKEQSFTRGAQSALTATVLALETREIEGTAHEFFLGDNDTSFEVTRVVVTDGKPQTGTAQIIDVPGMVVPVPPRTVSEGVPEVERFPHAAPHSVHERFRRITENAMHIGDQDSIMVIMSTDADLHAETISLHTRTRPLALRRVVGDWITRAPQPIAERVDKVEIGEVLQQELAKLGINAEPSFGVVKPADEGFFEFKTTVNGYSTSSRTTAEPKAEVVLASDNITDAELFASPYKHQLFPLDPFASPYDLVMVFPEQKMYLFWQIWPLWLASILFIAVIVYSFARAWRTNTEQRRFADQLMDFINNMTHEFKTPISTVGLAGEAITRDDVRDKPEVLSRYVGMIRDENERMHRQVEKILQMARFERGDIELKHEPIILHDLLAAVAESFSLQIEQRGGELVQALQAADHEVRGDRVHLESIFSNLVDNAVKYSPEAPQVKIATAVVDGFLVVKVTDQGMGIERDNQRRVFEKYYRCPTGNRHDVKGYGLGLSFVQSLVAAHHGFVELNSLGGQGTTVTVSLPLLTSETAKDPT